MRSIVILGCYFGELRSDFEMWLESCKNNPTIHWTIFTDHKEIACLPNNVENIFISFLQLKEMIQEKLQMQICLEKPYKLCDYKVAYGYIFEKYIKNYDFWAYCDFDMLFGDIRAFLTDEVLEKYDKIYYQGHLSFYRNTEENNKRFMKQGECLNYKTVFQNYKIYVFDEKPGIYQFYKNNNWPMYIKIDYADIVKQCKRFRMASNTLEDKRLQTFIWNKGKLYRIYVEDDGKIHQEELIYIHYSGRIFESILQKESFLITNHGFLPIDSKIIDKELIAKVNPPKNQFLEKLEVKANIFKYRLKRKIFQY